MGDLERYSGDGVEFPRWLRRQWTSEQAKTFIEESKKALSDEMRVAHGAKMHGWAKGWIIESGRDTFEAMKANEGNPFIEEGLFQEEMRFQQWLRGQLGG